MVILIAGEFREQTGEVVAQTEDEPSNASEHIVKLILQQAACSLADA